MQTDELHALMTTILLKSRMEISDILTGIVNECLSHILKTLESPQVIHSDELDSESEKNGKNISRCSAQADNDIQAAIKEFFIVFNPIHKNSFDVLNIVLEQIVEWNLTSDPNDIVDRVTDVLAARKDEFLSDTLPVLEDEVLKFKSVLILIPLNVSRCLNEFKN